MTASRVGASASATARSWTWSPRAAVAITPASPATTSGAPTAIVPSTSVPVTTVPALFTENTRSTLSRARPLGRGGASARSIRRTAARTASIPSPVRAEHADLRREPAREQLHRLFTREPRQILADAIELGHRHHRARDPEQLAHRHVLAGLRHHPFIRGDDEQHGLHPDRPGDHRVDEATMAGDIDQAHLEVVTGLHGAKPSSMVIPRFCSSGSRSVATPVRARTSVVLP